MGVPMAGFYDSATENHKILYTTLQLKKVN